MQQLIIKTREAKISRRKHLYTQVSRFWEPTYKRLHNFFKYCLVIICRLRIFLVQHFCAHVTKETAVLLKRPFADYAVHRFAQFVVLVEKSHVLLIDFTQFLDIVVPQSQTAFLGSGCRTERFLALTWKRKSAKVTFCQRLVHKISQLVETSLFSSEPQFSTSIVNRK